MKRKLVIGFLAVILLQQYIMGQSESYTIKKASFSSVNFDEFSPVYYNNGIVFCTNRNPNLFLNYSSSQNKRQFKIYYIDTTGNRKSRNARLLSKNLTTKFNDGPVTFSPSGDTIYYCRNLKVDGKLREISGAQNKLGLFTAVLEGKKWTKIREFRFNKEWYNISTPWLSSDGTKLYFASDKPGGYGGSDLYYCQWKDDYWGDPINLGPRINTSGNESYPFVNTAGELYFSSDGLPGLGGKDIFFSRYVDTTWMEPVPLDPPINSKFNDFGIIIDSTFSDGYFSSNREGSNDIFKFKTNFPQIFYPKVQESNQYCFKFEDDGSLKIDNNILSYAWYFGESEIIRAPNVEYCFPGPGRYTVKLNVLDKGTSNVFFQKLFYDLDLKAYEQPFIASVDATVLGDSIHFDGLKSNLPGWSILCYSWDFGDGTKAIGEIATHSFSKAGEQTVKLGLNAKSNTTGKIRMVAVSKKIMVFNDSTEKTSYLKKINSIKKELPDIIKYKNPIINTYYPTGTTVLKDSVFQVEILSSKTKIGMENNNLAKVPKKYKIDEIFDQIDSTYRYIVDQQLNLLATYPAYKEMIALGFKETVVRTYILKDPAEIEVNSIKKSYGVSTDVYFDIYRRLTPNAYILLDQIVKVMNKYPGKRLEVAVHSDNASSSDRSLILSQEKAQTFVNYLISKGITSKMLVAKGYGSSKPISPNWTEQERKLNRRVDFTIIKE